MEKHLRIHLLTLDRKAMMDYYNFIQISFSVFSQLSNEKNIKRYSKIKATDQWNGHKSRQGRLKEDLQLRWDAGQALQI